MTTLQFITGLLDWLLADPSHIVTAAAALAAATPTPDPNTPWGKLYKVLDIFALNFLHAKDSGAVASQPASTPSLPQAGMFLLAAGLAAGLSACAADGQLTPAAQRAVTVACAVDAGVQPVAVTLAGDAGPKVAALASADQQLVHPAVVAACQAVKGTPVAVTVAAAAPPAAAH